MSHNAFVHFVVPKTQLQYDVLMVHIPKQIYN